MTLDTSSILPFFGDLITQIEGPYKWYIMGGVAFILTGFITRYIFKTFKWFLLLLLVATLMFGGFYFIMNVASIN